MDRVTRFGGSEGGRPVISPPGAAGAGWIGGTTAGAAGAGGSTAMTGSSRTGEQFGSASCIARRPAMMKASFEESTS